MASGLAARLCRVPHAWHLREFFSEFPRLWRLYRAGMLALSDCVVCVSQAVAGQFPSKAQAGVRVIHDGFPRDEFAEPGKDRVLAFRERFGLGDSRLVGLIGRIKLGRKGQDTFVRAAARTAPDHPDARFLVVGAPFPGNEDHLEALHAMVDELALQDRVVFTGELDDVRPVVAACDVLVMASGTPEPFAGTVIEAMALGKPVVGARVGGTAEQIVDGETGILVEANNPGEMAGAIDRLLSRQDLRESMGTRGRRRFLARFEFEEFYRNLSGLYAELVPDQALTGLK
jgi:glycosyltransferase involved in cell wall biosynthesis